MKSRRQLLPTSVRSLSRAESGKDRVIRFTASTENVARDGGIVLASGWDVDAYRDSHPVFLWAHNHDGLPIGRAVNVTKGKDSLIIDVEFAGEDQNHPFAETVFKLFEADFLRCVSVGFRVIKERAPTEDEKARGASWVCTHAQLMELSAVPVPSDPGAVASGREVADAVCRGVLGTKDARTIRHHLGAIVSWNDLADAIERESMKRDNPMHRDVEEAEAAFTLKIQEPEEFDTDSFKQFEYQADPMVIAVSGVMLEGGETLIQGLVFPKDAWASVEEVDAWWSENADAVVNWSGEEAPEEDAEAPEAPADDEPREEQEDIDPEDEDDDAEPEGRSIQEVLADLRTLLDELTAISGRTDTPSEEAQPPRSADPVDGVERADGTPPDAPSDDGLYAQLLDLTSRYVAKATKN